MRWRIKRGRARCLRGGRGFGRVVLQRMNTACRYWHCCCCCRSHCLGQTVPPGNNLLMPWKWICHSRWMFRSHNRWNIVPSFQSPCWNYEPSSYYAVVAVEMMMVFVLSCYPDPELVFAVEGCACYSFVTLVERTACLTSAVIYLNYFVGVIFHHFDQQEFLLVGGVAGHVLILGYSLP